MKSLISSKEYKLYANFLNKLAKELTIYYYSKLNKTFKVSNKLKNNPLRKINDSAKRIMSSDTTLNASNA